MPPRKPKEVEETPDTDADAKAPEEKTPARAAVPHRAPAKAESPSVKAAEDRPAPPKAAAVEAPPPPPPPKVEAPPGRPAAPPPAPRVEAPSVRPPYPTPAPSAASVVPVPAASPAA